MGAWLFHYPLVVSLRNNSGLWQNNLVPTVTRASAAAATSAASLLPLLPLLPLLALLPLLPLLALLALLALPPLLPPLRLRRPLPPAALPPPAGHRRHAPPPRPARPSWSQERWPPALATSRRRAVGALDEQGWDVAAEEAGNSQAHPVNLGCLPRVADAIALHHVNDLVLLFNTQCSLTLTQQG